MEGNSSETCLANFLNEHESPQEDFLANAVDGQLSWHRFMRRCNGIRSLLLSQVIDKQELEHIWRTVLGDRNTCDLGGYLAVSQAIDQYISTLIEHKVVVLRASDIAACIGAMTRRIYSDI